MDGQSYRHKNFHVAYHENNYHSSEMKKIVFVIDSLYNSGGMEHSMSVIAGALTEEYEVTVITGLEMEKPLFYPLSPAVHYVDIGVNADLRKKTFRQHPVMEDYRCKLESFLYQNRMDYVVSLGGITQYFLYKIKDGSKKILWFKFEINIFKVWAQGKPLKVWAEATFQKYRMIYHISRFDKIILLTNRDAGQWRKFTSRGVCIYNPLTLDGKPKVSDLSAKQVIAVGRLTKVKGFDYLIDAWRCVHKHHPDWKLYIYGEGDDRGRLQWQIDHHHLQDVVFLPGRTKDIVSKYAESSMFVLSSREEGFGNVLTEAEACGLPVIAFDCPYGPGEIIRDGYNGFLIPRIGDVDMLAEKINLLIENRDLRKGMGQNALADVARFSVGKIKEEWIKMLQTL